MHHRQLAGICAVRDRVWMDGDKVLNVAGHTDATPAGCIVPFDVNTHKFIPGLVELDPMELLENIAEMVEAFYPNILHPKVINYEAEFDGTPFVVPEAWGGFGLAISFGKKVGSEEIFGKNANLGQAITALANLEVNPPITIATLKVVFFNEFRWNVSNINGDIFRVRHQSIAVEVLEVDGAKACTWARKHAVEKKLDKFKVGGVGSHVAREADAIAADGDAGLIRIILFRMHFTYHHGVADFLLFMEQDVVVVNKEEGISARNPFYDLFYPVEYLGDGQSGLNRPKLIPRFFWYISTYNVGGPIQSSVEGAGTER